MNYGHPLYAGMAAWHQPPVEEASARHRSAQQERSESRGINLATWHDPSRYDLSRVEASRSHRERLELERREMERRFEIPEQKYIPEQKFIPPTETDMRLEQEIDFLFNNEKMQKGPQHNPETIESTPDIFGDMREMEAEESDSEWKNGPPKPSFIEETEIKQEDGSSTTPIDPELETPRLEKWFRINPSAGKSMIDHYTFQLNELRKSRYEKLKHQSPEEAIPPPKLEPSDITAWFTNRRNKGGSSKIDPSPCGSGGKLYNMVVETSL